MNNNVGRVCYQDQGFIQDFLVGVEKMMRTKPCPLGGCGGVGVCSPKNFLCFAVAFGAIKMLEISY